VRSGTSDDSEREADAETCHGWARFPGHLRAEGPLVQTALVLLVKHYDDYQPFVDDCSRVKQAIGDESNRTSPTAFEQRMRGRDAIIELAKRWNLDRIPHFREHSYWHLRRAVDQVGRQFGNITGKPFSPVSITDAMWEPECPVVAFQERRWAWSLGSYETLAELRDRIADDLDVVPSNLPSEVVQQLWSLPDQARRLTWKLTDLPHRLPTHIHWLFLRLCPQPDRPLSISQIADRETEIVDERTIRRAVKDLAAAMGIRLPRLRPGRPRRRRRTAAPNQSVRISA
jgi:hypothetical protein